MKSNVSQNLIKSGEFHVPEYTKNKSMKSIVKSQKCISRIRLYLIFFLIHFSNDLAVWFQIDYVWMSIMLGSSIAVFAQKWRLDHCHDDRADCFGDDLRLSCEKNLIAFWEHSSPLHHILHIVWCYLLRVSMSFKAHKKQLKRKKDKTLQTICCQLGASLKYCKGKRCRQISCWLWTRTVNTVTHWGAEWDVDLAPVGKWTQKNTGRQICWTHVLQVADRRTWVWDSG